MEKVYKYFIKISNPFRLLSKWITFYIFAA